MRTRVIAPRGDLDLFGGVRLLSPFDPRRVPGLTHWYRADRVVLNGSTVSAMIDLSGRGNHATQGTGTAQPEWVETAYNGRPALRFDGSLKFMTATGDSPIGARTYFWVHKASKTTEYRIFDHSPSAILLMNFTPLALLSLGGNNYRYFADSPATDDNLPHVWSLEIAGSAAADINNARLLVDGTALGIFSTFGGSAPDAWSTLRIGAGSARLQGDLAEFMIFNRVVTASERARVESYLKQRYGVT